MSNQAKPNTLVPLPANLQTLYEREAFIIRRKWFSVAAVFLLFFGLIWNGFMVVWMTTALKNGAWAIAAFGSIHAGVGVFLAYFCAASFLNTTEIQVDPNYLRVEHSPVPWPGKKKIRVHTIQQLYSKKHVKHTKNGTNTSYRVFAVTDDNREHKLVTGLSEISQAHFIEHEIENVLGLEDLPVSGEHPKT
ncbi:MAG TPA: hypothetical protein DEA90_14725 [Opitutae bacterium]|nr:hypothetical protein [Puniceicoccaceae bacterium]HBR95412.1 hypothetical protein [Opitutae bacterium]|tara:strand:- start:4246 stop:4818 length:573 start_codon:yes stop_codon:yes gene_type:complete